MSAPARRLRLTDSSDPVPSLPVEVKLRQQLAFLRAEDAELLAYARAVVAARRDGWPDPAAILAELLEARGQMPRDDQHPTALMAQAYPEQEAEPW